MKPEGFISQRSSFDPRQTMDRLAAAVVAGGMPVLARIDHAAAAAQVGLDLRATEVLMFGNAKAGTPVMQDVQTAAVDLPLKAVVWADATGTTWIGYNDPVWIGERHELAARSQPILAGMAEKLAKIVAAAGSAGALRRG